MCVCLCESKSGRTGDSRTDGVEHVLLTVSQTDQYGVSCSGDRRRRGLTPQTIVMTGRVGAWERKWEPRPLCSGAPTLNLSTGGVRPGRAPLRISSVRTGRSSSVVSDITRDIMVEIDSIKNEAAIDSSCLFRKRCSSETVWGLRLSVKPKTNQRDNFGSGGSLVRQ